MSVSMSTAAAPLAHLKPSPATQIAAFPTSLSIPNTRPLSIITCSSSKALQTPTATDRVFNFTAGPATLPENVLLKAQSELHNWRGSWRGSGMSVMEMSHRGKDFLSIIQKAESDLRSLLNIPSDYTVLFL